MYQIPTPPEFKDLIEPEDNSFTLNKLNINIEVISKNDEIIGFKYTENKQTSQKSSCSCIANSYTSSDDYAVIYSTSSTCCGYGAISYKKNIFSNWSLIISTLLDATVISACPGPNAISDGYYGSHKLQVQRCQYGSHSFYN